MNLETTIFAVQFQRVIADQWVTLTTVRGLTEARRVADGYVGYFLGNLPIRIRPIKNGKHPGS